MPPIHPTACSEKPAGAVRRAIRHEACGLVGLLVFALAALPGCGPHAGAPAVIERELGAMGTYLSVRVTAPTRREALLASEAAVREVEAAERRLSNWRADSELARFDPELADASPELAADLAALAPCAARVAGAFDPSVASPGRGPHGLLDSGGFGKGRALDLALAAARERGATTVELDLGGQTARLSLGGVHEVRIADPRLRTRAVVAVDTPHSNVATSCQSERAGHLVDPASGGAVPFDGSLTVFASSALLADVLSTGLFVLGPKRAVELAGQSGDFEVLVLTTNDDGLSVHTSAGLVGCVRALVNDVALAPTQIPSTHP